MQDLEAHLRRCKELEGVLISPFTETKQFETFINDEGRIVMRIEGREFVVFGHNTAPWSEPVKTKPTTQRVAIPGLDSFKPMGSR